MNKLRVAILSHGGLDLVLKKLCELEGVEVVGVFVETQSQPQRSWSEKIKRSVFYYGYAETAKKIIARVFRGDVETEKDMHSMHATRRNIEHLCMELNVPYFEVDRYDSSEAMELLRNSNIDLGVLYGTNIIRESVFNIPKRGSINLHQGLAPYYRGGPPLFWELLNGEDKVGITIHYVAARVDSGDIILQETVPLEYDYSKYGLEYESFLRDRSRELAEPSARLMAEAIELISESKDRPVKQDASVGKRYRLPSKREKSLLVDTLRKRRDRERANYGSSSNE